MQCDGVVVAVAGDMRRNMEHVDALEPRQAFSCDPGGLRAPPSPRRGPGGLAGVPARRHPAREAREARGRVVRQGQRLLRLRGGGGGTASPGPGLEFKQLFG